jgi:N-glycosidase YbiA
LAIYFNAHTEDFDWLSSFSRHGFELDSKYWPTVEHYVQAQKFSDDDFAETIRLCGDARTARRMGGSRKHPRHADWDARKDDVMRLAIRAKFRTHPDLVELLLATGDEELVESSPRDYYWGCGAKRTGKNMLGKILMGLRQELATDSEWRAESEG